MRFNLDLLNSIEFKPELNPEISKAMKQIYPNASDEDLREGNENLETYLKIALKISARLLNEQQCRSFDGNPKTSYHDAKVEWNL